MLDVALHIIFCQILSGTENNLSDTILHIIFCWTLSGTENILSDTVLQSILLDTERGEKGGGGESEKETHLSSITGDKFVEVEGNNLADIALCTLDHFGRSSLEQFKKNFQTKILVKIAHSMPIITTIEHQSRTYLH